MTLTKATRDWILSAAAQSKVCGQAGQIIGRIEPLLGGSVSAIYAIDIFSPNGAPRQFVLRQYTDQSRLADEPDIVEHEAAALVTAFDAGLPCPRLIAFDSEALRCDVPSLLMTRMLGAPNLMPVDLFAWLNELAGMLASIHRVHHVDLRRQYRLWIDVDQLEIPSWADNRSTWKALHGRVMAGPPPAATGFLHRDYHPGNILWHNGRISGIVDWVNCCIGPLEVDVSHCRKNLAILHGIESAETFDRRYRNLTGAPIPDPYWDACAIADNGPDFDGYMAFRSFGVPITAHQITSRINAFATHVAKRLKRDTRPLTLNQ
jgi:aminoglycoside phosphotransferase (APT) family kinase protein